MPWPGAPLRIALLLLAATVGPPGALAEGNVGCLFSERLCLEDEWCFDDYAFGRCLPATSDVDEDDLYRYNLEREVLHQISRELRRLFALGYRWSHGYTQCRLQAMLYATQHDLFFDANACSHLVDQDLEGALKALEGQLPIDPREVAIIKYTPSIEDPNADFADEVYYPPVDESAIDAALREKILGPSAIDILDMEDPYAQYEMMKKRTWIPQMHRRSPSPENFADYYSGNAERRNPEDLEFLPELNAQPPDELSGIDPILRQLEANAEASQRYDKFQRLLQEFNDKERPQDFANWVDDDDLQPFEKFTSTYNTPDSFRAGWESRDSIPESRIYFDENDPSSSEEEYGSGFNYNLPEGVLRGFTDEREDTAEEIFRELKNNKPRGNEGIYTEGGVVYAPNIKNYDLSSGERDELLWKDNLDKILAKYNLGFKRPERLDVKKPGPPFDTRAIPPKNDEEDEGEISNRLLPSMMKKRPIGVHPNPGHEIDFDIDSNYVYVGFDKEVKRWREGDNIIKNITELLKFKPYSAQAHIVKHNEVVLKVVPNDRDWNSSEVARRIDGIRDKLEAVTGVKITKIGIGDKFQKEPIWVSLPNREDVYMKILIGSCISVAVLISAALLFLITKHLKARDKLQGLGRPDTEASKDYQDLCRARMATKGQTTTTSTTGETVHGRITSLSRESEQSPSSRSSTSSWSEEPALHNMDISTGHMVLSYMEDHLKNKDRLDQEWVALCAYLAEPCEATIALKKENVEKNRYPEIIPYDHSRVVLNELSNAASSDYINASSITDHDPRNPAYIASQGPLPHTAADFWQLIWEQGAVVIVMLTRLTEGGAAMCHRYWPEEGSELYHIYEVHLVSEHIWCDDYLVRSFYLKNARTGETRTVTQFHFLSWPESGVPSSTKALLEFRRKVNKSYRGRSCPIVVHCSDGAGRTGTYCLIDMVLSRMAKGAKEIDIAATLEHLRDQRPKMVATKQQFEFVLTAVAEEVHAILKALPPQPAAPTQPEKEK